MRTIGAGHTSIEEFCRVMGLPDISKNTYHTHTKRIYDRSNRAAEENLQITARKVPQAYEEAYEETLLTSQFHMMAHGRNAVFIT